MEVPKLQADDQQLPERPPSAVMGRQCSSTVPNTADCQVCSHDVSHDPDKRLDWYCECDTELNTAELAPPDSSNEEDQFSHFWAMRVQACWRGYVVRKWFVQRVAALAACSYVHGLVPRIFETLPPRTRAKVFIRVRNRRITLLRDEIDTTWSINVVRRSTLQDELDGHLYNVKHQLRAAMLLQAWWRGCRSRGMVCRSRLFAHFFDGPKVKVPVEIGSGATDMKCIDGPNDPKVWQGQNHEEFREWSDVGSLASSLPVLSTFASYLWTRDECYPKTNVKRIPVPNARTHSDGRPRRIIIFFSDTGGGHRASALALQSALNRLYAGRINVKLVDFLREATGWPWNWSPEMYAALGHAPSVYKKIYDHESGQLSWRETRSFGLVWGASKSSVYSFLTRTYSEGVDLIVSVHPLINHLVMEAFAEIFNGKNIIPVVTVVTDLGSAHLSWFDPRVDLIFVPNSRLQDLALNYRVPRAKVCVLGLPVREGFWEPHNSPKKSLQEHLGLSQEHPMVVLLMGGGEGFGSLKEVAIAIGERLIQVGHVQLVVICGRNEEARQELQKHRWPLHFNGTRMRIVPKILGFVSNVHEYMSAADCLVTKAGPGSIAEAMIKGLPCLITSFLPGQEEGNVNFIVDAEAGEYVSDADPDRVADRIVLWVSNPDWLQQMSENAKSLARPRAALDIAQRMCESQLDFGIELTEAGATTNFARSRDGNQENIESGDWLLGKDVLF
mmetsp:Transcript_118177/g.235395  ORF Transcript_118177/g.235395 Transcript_118177/m.235395 type:complete len:728 (+) Transcript_118177:165-2348(+)